MHTRFDKNTLPQTKLLTKLIHASYYILYYDRADPFKIFYLEKRRYLSAVIQNFVWGNNDSKEMFKSQITKF